MLCITTLPSEVLLQILSHLDAPDLRLVRAVCQCFATLVEEDILWRGLLLRDAVPAISAHLAYESAPPVPWRVLYNDYQPIRQPLMDSTNELACIVAQENNQSTEFSFFFSPHDRFPQIQGKFRSKRPVTPDDHRSWLELLCHSTFPPAQEIQSVSSVDGTFEYQLVYQSVVYFEICQFPRAESISWEGELSPALGVGLKHADAPPLVHQFPGWPPRTTGYHSDDGKLFYGSPSSELFGPPWDLYDIVGCGYDHRRQRVFYTHNGTLLETSPPIDLVDENQILQIVGGITVDSPNCVVVNRGQVPYCYSLDNYDHDVQDLLLDVEFHAPAADSLVVWDADHSAA